MTELAKRIPIGTFVDHGPSVEPREQVQGFQAAYAELYNKAKHLVVKPGDRVPVTGLDWRIVTAGGQALMTPLVGAGQTNALCTGAQMKDPNPTDENSQSVGSVVTLGQFKAVDLGDLLWANEHDLMCPRNMVGTVDLLMVSHHGLDQSNSPVLVRPCAACWPSCRTARPKARQASSRRSRRSGTHRDCSICGSCTGTTTRASNRTARACSSRT